MICINCGKEIPFGDKTCKYCNKETEFEARYHYMPERIPVYRGYEEVTMNQILEKIDNMDEKLKTLAIGKDLRKVIPVNAGICAVLFAISLLGSFLMIRNTAGRVHAEMEAISSQVEALEEVQANTAEKVEKLIEKEEAVERKISAPVRYWITFDLNLPDAVETADIPSPGAMAFYPEEKGALYLPKPEELEGYNFMGWKNRDDGELLQPGAEIDLPLSDITLYAEWEPKNAAETAGDESVSSDPVVTGPDDELQDQKEEDPGEEKQPEKKSNRAPSYENAHIPSTETNQDGYELGLGKA